MFVPLVTSKAESEEGPSSSSSMLWGLEHFTLAAAHCFDPNEESRLRNIIHARGDDEFEQRVRQLASVCIGGLKEGNVSSTVPGFRRQRT